MRLQQKTASPNEAVALGNPLGWFIYQKGRTFS